MSGFTYLKMPRQPFVAALALAVLLGGMTAAENAGYFSTGTTSESLGASVLPGAVIALTNNKRADRGAPALKANALLNQAAQMKADDMAANSYYSHISPDGTAPPYWVNKVGYRYSEMGENLVIDRESSDAVVSAWMGSDSHRENMLNPNLTEIGVGVAKGSYKGRDTIYVVQIVARPLYDDAPAKPKPAKAVVEPKPVKVVEQPKPVQPVVKPAPAPAKPVQVQPTPTTPVPVRTAATTSVLVRPPETKPVIQDPLKPVLEVIASSTLVEVPSIVAEIAINLPPVDPAFATEPVELSPTTTTATVATHTPLRSKMRTFVNGVGVQMRSFLRPLF